MTLPWILSATLFLGLIAQGLRHPAAWTSAAGLIWLAALYRPPIFTTLPARTLWALFLMWVGLSAICSSEPLRSLASFSHTATTLLFFSMACSYWRDTDRRMWFLYLCAAGAVLALAAFLLDIPGYPMVGLLWPYNNYTACVQAAVFAAGLGALGENYPKSVKGKIFLLGCMTLSILFLLLSRSRGGLLACGAALSLWLWRRQGRLVLLLCWTGISAIMAFLPKPFLVQVLKLDHPAAYVRTKIWSSALAIAKEHPVLGEGPGQFERGFLRHNFPTPEGVWPTRYGLRSTHAHSEPLHMAAETGWVGLLLWLAALARSAFATFRRKKTWIRESASCAFSAISVHALVDNILALPALGFLYFSTLAVIPRELSSRGIHEVAPFGRTLRWLALCGLLLSCAAWWPDWALKRLRAKAYQLQGPGSLAYIHKALSLSSQDASLWEDMARLHLRQSPPDLDLALKALSKASQLNPTNALYLLIRAEVLRSRGLWPEVLSLTEAALHLEPLCFQARLLRVEALYQIGRRDEALRELDKMDTVVIAMAETGPSRSLKGYDAFILYKDVKRYRKVRALVQKNKKP